MTPYIALAILLLWGVVLAVRDHRRREDFSNFRRQARDA
jgi:hypothetical protein